MEESQTFYIETTLWLSKLSIAFNPLDTEFSAMKAINQVSFFLDNRNVPR